MRDIERNQWGQIVGRGDIVGKPVHIWHGRNFHLAANYSQAFCGKYWTGRIIDAGQRRGCGVCSRRYAEFVGGES